jgi:hypothetical protein
MPPFRRLKTGYLCEKAENLFRHAYATLQLTWPTKHDNMKLDVKPSV